MRGSEETQVSVPQGMGRQRWADYLSGQSVAVGESHADIIAGHVELQDAAFFNVVTDDYEGHASTDSPACRMAIAATALWGQSFGFSWDMVDAIRSVPFRDEDFVASLHLAVVADSIERLLPPRDLADAFTKERQTGTKRGKQ